MNGNEVSNSQEPQFGCLSPIDRDVTVRTAHARENVTTLFHFRSESTLTLRMRSAFEQLSYTRSRLRGGRIAVCPLRPKQKREESMSAGDRRELFALIDWKDIRQSSPPHFS